MRPLAVLRPILLVAAMAACCALPAWSASPVTVIFGASWDGASNELQHIVDVRYGAGHINVHTDYMGAKAGDIDPWFWIDHQFSALLIREVAGNANANVLGWYAEPGTYTLPVLDGVGDGVVFNGPAGSGATHTVVFDQPLRKFGFYLDPNGPNGAVNAPQPELFYTNRLYNDKGPNGSGALHAPYDGDVQALVFDVSPWTSTSTWLVCFEDLDSGANPGASCCSQTDNDFNDLIFEVQALGATPTVPLSFGALKARYR